MIPAEPLIYYRAMMLAHVIMRLLVRLQHNASWMILRSITQSNFLARCLGAVQIASEGKLDCAYCAALLSENRNDDDEVKESHYES